MSREQVSYPISVKGELSEPPSRGWWLLKWLLGIPHYFVIYFFQGGAGERRGGGPVSILAIFAALALLFTGKYPGNIFKLVVGMNRWTYRAIGYASLMTDKYPPFRLEENS